MGMSGRRKLGPDAGREMALHLESHSAAAALPSEAEKALEEARAPDPTSATVTPSGRFVLRPLDSPLTSPADPPRCQRSWG